MRRRESLRQNLERGLTAQLAARHVAFDHMLDHRAAHRRKREIIAEDSLQHLRRALSQCESCPALPDDKDLALQPRGLFQRQACRMDQLRIVALNDDRQGLGGIWGKKHGRPGQHRRNRERQPETQSRDIGAEFAFRDQQHRHGQAALLSTGLVSGGLANCQKALSRLAWIGWTFRIGTRCSAKARTRAGWVT